MYSVWKSREELPESLGALEQLEVAVARSGRFFKLGVLLSYCLIYIYYIKIIVYHILLWYSIF